LKALGAKPLLLWNAREDEGVNADVVDVVVARASAIWTESLIFLIKLSKILLFCLLACKEGKQ